MLEEINTFFNLTIFLFQVHSETIATYALCGFSNFASLGMTVGAMGESYGHWGKVKETEIKELEVAS